MVENTHCEIIAVIHIISILALQSKQNIQKNFPQLLFVLTMSDLISKRQMIL